MKSVIVTLFAAAIGCALVQPVFAAEGANAKEKVLYSFCGQANCTDGEIPFGNVLAIKGILYGTTDCGGGGGGQSGKGCGTVFSVAAKTGVEKVLHSFCLQQGCTDGSWPKAGLIDVNGTLVGTTSGGGGSGCASGGCGSVFSINPNTGAEKLLYSFSCLPNCTGGATPLGGLIYVKGMLYGTTEFGGTNDPYGYGTLFALDLESGLEKVLYSFCNLQNCTDGEYPGGGLIDVEGTLFGTAGGGAYGGGLVFALDLKTGTEKVLHSFEGGTDGWIPAGGLIDVSGTLYGATVSGGTSAGCVEGCGTVFAINPQSGTETVLYSFCSQQDCTDGAQPSASLLDLNGTLYGTTLSGGTSTLCSVGCGTVFALDPKNNKESVIYSFCSQQNCTDGASSYASLIAAKNKLYGTTAGGGTHGYGTVFVLNP